MMIVRSLVLFWIALCIMTDISIGLFHKKIKAFFNDIFDDKISARRQLLEKETLEECSVLTAEGILMRQYCINQTYFLCEDHYYEAPPQPPTNPHIVEYMPQRNPPPPQPTFNYPQPKTLDVLPPPSSNPSQIIPDVYIATDSTIYLIDETIVVDS